MSGIARITGRSPEAKRYEVCILACLLEWPLTIFQGIARDYISKWEVFGISRDGTHAKLAYDWFGSWTTLYNLYVDSLLCFHIENSVTTSPSASIANPERGDQRPLVGRETASKNSTGFVPNRIYKMQSDWYHYVMQTYGLPLDNRHLYTKSDWQFFAAAVTSSSTRGEILESVAKWVNETGTGTSKYLGASLENHATNFKRSRSALCGPLQN